MYLERRRLERRVSHCSPVSTTRPDAMMPPSPRIRSKGKGDTCRVSVSRKCRACAYVKCAPSHYYNNIIAYILTNDTSIQSTTKHQRTKLNTFTQLGTLHCSQFLLSNSCETQQMGLTPPTTGLHTKVLCSTVTPSSH